MFKSLDNNNSIPNNYVYTSNKGTEYMYLDGSWLNCETMSTVPSTHNFKMNESAIRQIAEHNRHNKLQIGKKYVIKESEYVYVGRNNFTLNDNLLTENVNSRVKMLVEADAKSEFSNVKLGSTENIEIPDKFKLDGYVYNKAKKAWWGTTDNGNAGYIKDQELIDELNKDSIERIKKYNEKDPYPVGTTVDYNGKTAIWNGEVFVVPGEGAYPPGFAQQFDDYFQNVYKSGNNNDSTEQQDKEDTVNTSDNSNTNEPQNTGSTSSTEVPNGFVYQSGKGKSYYKKNGRWFSSETKKPINMSSAKPLERAAQNAIDKHNASASVKIGDTFTSKKGITYKYVGGNRFISADGKLLPKDTAQNVLNNLRQQADEKKAQEQGSTDNQEQGTTEPAPQPSTEPTPTQGDNTQDTNSNTDNGSDDPLSGLAKQIKSNPEARRIIVLLSRGDELSLLAADILLSGQQKEVTQILNSLNNEE
ncbi:virion structural protein [Cronobacter phage vB_CsaM_GAP32]|uniref:Uncharacterized protein n=1 Tax=Cronobacter phage vB_CsaM_GAP32 TaxID=1141136 RepID=K4F604_9CAUD|nr:virion structural protein [Cronobacter phage vB_CsaM_GAP32]AFC21656.1 hypothetical protein GAP32_206 [Cronobacter phage vB_CsaM_GAP32]